MTEINDFPPAATSQELLAQTNLHYVSGAELGYHRRRAGRGFTYLDSSGERVRDPELRARFEALVIPPAWQEVWICADPQGHIQATGRDEAGRKQYIYHPDWELVREQTKFARLLAFGEALPSLRAQVEADLRTRGLTRTKVLALAVRLLELTLIRVGNPEYERQNQTYGLTTLLDDHVDVNGGEIVFEFRGKSGKEHEIVVNDRRLARLVKACQELPGQRLFQYKDEEGEIRAIDSGAVNDYLRTVTGCDFTAKEFRTWGATVHALQLLRQCGPADSETACARQITAAIKEVAAALGNTPAVCRQHYVHPAVVEAYSQSVLEEVCRWAEGQTPQSPHALQNEEAALLLLLRRYQPIQCK
jgi:DNA topoisomerase I